MKHFKTILVGISYTDSSRHALNQAHRIATESGATLRALHVVPPAEINEFVNFYMIERSVMMNSALSSLEDFVSHALGDNHQVTCQVVEGHPHHELVTMADEIKADLVVLASNDSAKKPRKAGQFAIKCLRFTSTPVLLVSHQADRPFAKITACIDFSDSTKPILETMAKMAFDKSPQIEIIHAICPPWLSKGRAIYLPDMHVPEEQKKQFHEILEAELHASAQSASDLFRTKPTCLSLEHEDIHYALLNHLRDSHTDLAVVGRSGKGAKGLKTDLLGGTAETLIRHASCSVLVVPH